MTGPTEGPLLTIDEICKEIESTGVAPYHRGKSWEHCYTFFRDRKKFEGNEKLIDQAALHLGFYLASWGMLRGSSFLLQMDYKYYVSIVRKLIEPQYDALWDIHYLGMEEKKEEAAIALLFQLKSDLFDVIKKNNAPDERDHQTELIITKIIMGTMGCVPAYDRYFKIGLNKYPASREVRGISSFQKKSFKQLLDISRKDEMLREIYKVSVPIGRTGWNYPPMKLLDLFFWLLGKDR